MDVPGYGEIRRCPVTLLTDEVLDVMGLYNQCRSTTQLGLQPNGVFPESGGLLDQSATLIDAFRILDKYVNEAFADRLKNG